MLDPQVAAIAVDGKLPTFSWPGGYPLVYVNNQGYTLCPDCANNHAEYDETITQVYANEENAFEQCNHCNAWIDPGLLSEEEVKQIRFEQMVADNVQRAHDNLDYRARELAAMHADAGDPQDP